MEMRTMTTTIPAIETAGSRPQSVGLLRLREAAKRIGCSVALFDWWDRNGCPYCPGFRLRDGRDKKLAPRTAGHRRGPAFVREKDVGRIAKGFAEAADPPDTIIRSGNEFYTIDKAVRYSGLLKHTIQHNAKRLSSLHLRLRGIQTAYYSREKLDELTLENAAWRQGPSDPDLISLADTKRLVRCSAHTLRRLVKAGVLHPTRPYIVGQDGKGSRQLLFSRSELHMTFVQRPEPGEPIRVGPEETYYLREDGKAHFHFSDSVLAYWIDVESNLRPGEMALRTKTFYVIADQPRQGSGPESLAWRGEDLRAIVTGKEGSCPGKGRGPFARTASKAARAHATKVLKGVKRRLPMRAADAIKLCEEAGVPGWLIFRTKKALNIQTSRQVAKGKAAHYWWHKPGQKVPAGALAAPSPGATSAAPFPSTAHTSPAAPIRRWVRPCGRTAYRVENETKMLAAWDRRQFGENKAATGAAFNIDRSDATKLINMHERQKCRK
jgi:hypothetical protein